MPGNQPLNYPGITPNRPLNGPPAPPAPGTTPGYNPQDPYDPRVGNGLLPQGITGAAERAYVGYVQPDQLAMNHLNQYTEQNNPYMQNATRAGMRVAGARGLLNSSIAAGASRRSAIEAAAPIAMFDAKAYQDTAHQNVDVLNQRANAQDSASATLGAAGSAAAASMYGDDIRLQGNRENLAFQGEQNQMNRIFDDYQAGRGYGMALGLQNNQFGNQLNNQMRTDAFNAAINSYASNQNFRQGAAVAAMNNPFIIQNPQAFSGYLDYIGNGYRSNINQFLDFALGGI